MKRGSALIMALLVIAVLSVMVLSFSVEAHLQTGINVYMRERARVNRLTDSGRVIAEMLLEGYAEVETEAEDEDLAELLEKDRWILEKRMIKSGREATIGPIMIDDENPDSGTVTIKIRMANCAEKGLNVNELVDGSDTSYQLRWELIFRSHGLPLDFEVDVKDVGRVPLSSYLIAGWCDWVDKDDDEKTIDGVTCGAEKDRYEEFFEDEDVDDEDRKFPRNGPITDVSEISLIRAFREYPAILTGGPILGADEKSDPENNPTVRGILHLFNTKGTAKVNANDCTVDQLLTIPGLAQDDDDDDEMPEAREVAQAIVEGLKVKPEHRSVVDENAEEWPYQDFDDLNLRLLDMDVSLGSEAKEYIVFEPSESSLFSIEITGESLGMSHTVKASGYLKDGQVRYVEWRED